MWPVVREEGHRILDEVVTIHGHKTTTILRREAQLLVIWQPIKAALVRTDDVQSSLAGNPRDAVRQVFVQVEAHYLPGGLVKGYFFQTSSTLSSSSRRRRS